MTGAAVAGAVTPIDAPAAVRVDRWLCAARIFKTRTLAREACVAGHILVNGRAVRPSHVVRPGDRIEGKAPRGPIVLVVVAAAEKRVGPALARGLYEDHSPPPPPEDPMGPVLFRPRGLGRPTKADRRALQRLRRR